ncbi:MAG TPA: glycine oxidase ThiO [Longimicrobiales bacterium]
MSAQDTTDVIIAGGGIIGCSIAFELRRRGVGVLLLERDAPGRRATWAAGGMLSPLTESCEDNPFFDLAAHSFNAYPAFVERLHDTTGIDVDYRAHGKLHIVFDDESAAVLDRLAGTRYAAEYGVRLLSAADVHALEPALTTEVSRGAFVARDHLLDNRLLGQAAAAAAAAAGAQIAVASGVRGIITDSGRAVGVRLLSGDIVSAGKVVIAAGAWSGALEGLPRPLPVRPRAGQMFAVDTRADRATAKQSLTITHAIENDRCYLLPRSDGRLLAGATVEDCGFQRGPTVAGIGSMMAAAISVAPGIADLPIIETWMDYRPGTPDDLPIIGEDPDVDGLIYATGHFRNGILLAPATAEAIADTVTGSSPALIAPFSIARFG